MQIVVGISGASGAPYAMRLLEVLTSESLRKQVQVSLVLSSTAEQVLEHECTARVRDFGLPIFEGRDYNAPFASGSSAPDAMVIIPASMSTVAKVAHGISDNLLTRAADVMLKERRRLVLMVRETPFNLAHLRNMTAVTEMGGVIFPPLPAFYNRPQTIAELVDDTVERVIELLGVPGAAPKRWDGL